MLETPLVNSRAIATPFLSPPDDGTASRLFAAIVPRPRASRIAIGFGLLLGLAVIDKVTPPDLSFLVFYVVPILFLVWTVGEPMGVLASVLSAVAWFVDDVAAGHPFRHPTVPLWNVSVKLCLFLIVVHAVAGLKRALERQRTHERERFEREMTIAAEVQSRLFPQVLPATAGLEFAAACRPARHVSGDYYDLLTLGPGRFAVAVGDVSGKGIAAALLMASVHGQIRGRAPLHGDAIAVLLAAVNRSLCAACGGRSFVSLFYAVANEATGELSYVNAGHPAPILVRTGETRLIRLVSTGPVLGLLPGAAWSQETIPLQPGDTLVMFTDGVTEAMDAREQEFGESRLVRVIRSNREVAPGDMRDRILEEVDRFLGGHAPQDDLTVVVARTRSGGG